MSQFAKERTSAGYRFIAVIDAAPYKPYSLDALVTQVIMVDDGGDPNGALAEMDRLSREHVGKPCRLWEEG